MTTIKTEGEQLFEVYLASQGLTNFEFERTFPGKAKKPDYLVVVNGKECLFDIKDFEYQPMPDGRRDLYKRLRGRIDEARQKFREYKDWPCSVVMYNRGITGVHLTWPFVVLGAMFGDVGISWSVNKETGNSVPNSEHLEFQDGGKMLDPKSNRPQNTTISAVIALRYYSHPTSQEKGLGVIVYENEYARIPLTRELFCGPFDERYTMHETTSEKIFSGSGIADAA